MREEERDRGPGQEHPGPEGQVRGPAKTKKHPDKEAAGHHIKAERADQTDKGVLSGGATGVAAERQEAARPKTLRGTGQAPKALGRDGKAPVVGRKLRNHLAAKAANRNAVRASR